MIIENKDRFQIFAHKWLAKAQAKLHISPSAIALLDWDIVDRHGNPVLKHTGKSHSFTRNYSNMCCTSMLFKGVVGTTHAAGSTAVKDTGGVIRGLVGFAAIGHNGITAGAGSLTRGIIAGTSATAESYEDYAMGAIITHGSGSGQLTYGAQSENSTWDGGTKIFKNTIQRVLTNNSGADITINEVGLVDYMVISQLSALFAYVLIVRDTPTPIVVAAGNSATITYTFSYQYP